MRTMLDNSTEGLEPATLTGSEEELLTGILGQILDGMGDYSGTILSEVSELYNKLTERM